MNAVSVALALDPALIFSRAGMTPDPWQANVLRERAPQVLLNCSRQAGKSQTTAAIVLDEAISNAPALILVLSPSLRQSAESFRTIMQLYHRLGLGSVAPDQESSLRVQLPNGSRILALPGKEGTVRGFSKVGLLVVDEASRVEDSLYRAIRPMLAVSGGRIVVLSTPFGKRGFFHKEWMEGEGWARVKITADMCPRIPAAFLENERRSMPESWFLQEYFCHFADSEGAVFRYEDVVGAVTDSVTPLFNAPSAISSEIKPLLVS